MILFSRQIPYSVEYFCLDIYLFLCKPEGAVLGAQKCDGHKPLTSTALVTCRKAGTASGSLVS